MKNLFLAFLFLSLAAPALADRTLTLDDGKKIILRDNGAWVYIIAPENPRPEEEYLEISLAELKQTINSRDGQKIKTGGFSEMYGFAVMLMLDEEDDSPLRVNKH